MLLEHHLIPSVAKVHIKYQIQGKIMNYVKMNLGLEFQYPQVMQIGTFELALKKKKKSQALGPEHMVQVI